LRRHGGRSVSIFNICYQFSIFLIFSARKLIENILCFLIYKAWPEGLFSQNKVYALKMFRVICNLGERDRFKPRALVSFRFKCIVPWFRPYVNGLDRSSRKTKNKKMYMQRF
jgi:hypothetical protein